MKSWIFTLFFSLNASLAIAAGLDKDIEVDVLMSKITTLLQADKSAEALPYFARLEAKGTTLPESFHYYYIQALDKAGDSRAIDRAKDYMGRFGKRGKYYAKVVETLARASMQKEQTLTASAQSKYQAKDKTGALADWREIAAMGDPTAEIYYWIGKIELELNQIDPAEKDLERSTELNSGTAKTKEETSSLLAQIAAIKEKQRRERELAEQLAKQAAIEAEKYLADQNMVAIPAGNGVSTFEMGQTEVTQGQWLAIMGSNPSKFTACGLNCPVEEVSWDDIQVFLQKLNAKTGKQYRLPTEKEWLYACLAGQNSEYCGGNNLDAVAWYGSNSGNTTHPVKSKQANGYGLYDMSGNVLEWMSDCYDGVCSERVLRGGSWGGNPQTLRAADRGSFPPTSFRFNYIGFRVARTAP